MKWDSGNNYLTSWQQEKKLARQFEKSFVKNKVVFAESMYSKSEPMAASAKQVMDEIAMVGWVSGDILPVLCLYSPLEPVHICSGEKIDNTEILLKRIAKKAAGYK